MAGYQLRERAIEDLAEIWRYTAEHWGTEQADRYYHELIACFEAVTRNPQLGRVRDEIKAGYRSIPQGRHVVFYLIASSGIEIIGLPHQNEDVETHFSTGE